MSDDDEREQQQRLHEAIEAFLADRGELDDGELLIGWIVIHETAILGEHGHAACGHVYGPRELTTWRALGLVEWVRRFCLQPSEDDE